MWDSDVPTSYPACRFEIAQTIRLSWTLHDLPFYVNPRTLSQFAAFLAKFFPFDFIFDCLT